MVSYVNLLNKYIDEHYKGSVHLLDNWEKEFEQITGVEPSLGDDNNLVRLLFRLTDCLQLFNPSAINNPKCVRITYEELQMDYLACGCSYLPEDYNVLKQKKEHPFFVDVKLMPKIEDCFQHQGLFYTYVGVTALDILLSGVCTSISAPMDEESRMRMDVYNKGLVKSKFWKYCCLLLPNEVNTITSVYRDCVNGKTDGFLPLAAFRIVKLLGLPYITPIDVKKMYTLYRRKVGKRGSIPDKFEELISDIEAWCNNDDIDFLFERRLLPKSSELLEFYDYLKKLR